MPVTGSHKKTLLGLLSSSHACFRHKTLLFSLGAYPRTVEQEDSRDRFVKREE